MKFAEHLRKTLQESASIKTDLAANQQLCEQVNLIVASLKKSLASQGVIRIFSDSSSAWSAKHFNEELAIRFKAGSEFGRADREALNSRQYADLDSQTSIAMFDSDMFNAKLDSIVIFSTESDTPELVAVAECARKLEFTVCSFCPESNQTLKQLSNFCVAVPEFLRIQMYCLQSIFLHSVCEAFEPEYNASRHSFSACLRSSSETDQLIEADLKLKESFVRAKSELAQAQSAGALFVAGNGGSTCDAKNILQVIYRSELRNWDFVDLFSSEVLLCAYNDGFSPFARQIDATGKTGDTLVVLSTSGNSQNLVDAVDLAKQKGMRTIGLLGKDGGKLLPLCDHALVVKSKETARIQEAHLLLGYCLLSSSSR